MCKNMHSVASFIYIYIYIGLYIYKMLAPDDLFEMIEQIMT